MSKKQKKMLIRIIAAGAIWAIGFAVEHIFPTDDRFSLLGFIHLGIFTAAYLVIGWDILWKAIRNIAHGQVFDENFLMCIASIGAMVIGEYDEGRRRYDTLPDRRAVPERCGRKIPPLHRRDGGH